MYTNTHNMQYNTSNKNIYMNNPVYDLSHRMVNDENNRIENHINLFNNINHNLNIENNNYNNIKL